MSPTASQVAEESKKQKGEAGARGTEQPDKSGIRQTFRWMGHDQTTVQTAPQLPKPDPMYVASGLAS